MTVSAKKFVFLQVQRQFLSRFPNAASLTELTTDNFFQVPCYFKGCLELAIISSRKWEREIYRMDCQQAGQLPKVFLLKTWHIKHVADRRQPRLPVMPSLMLEKIFWQLSQVFRLHIKTKKKNQFNTPQCSNNPAAMFVLSKCWILRTCSFYLAYAFCNTIGLWLTENK